MIPKKIHYIWVGNNPKSNKVQKCIETWKNRFHDFEIIEWNEKNFDINSNKFVKCAYQAKKWAFVSDYIRLYALYNVGGVYLDTDVVAVDNIEDLMNDNVFIGFENEKYISAAIIGADKNQKFIKKMMEYYDNIEEKKDFNFEDNNSLIITNLLKNNYNLILNNKEQILKDGIKIYPDYILSNPSRYSKTIHVFTGTWLEEKSSLKKKICQSLKYQLTTQKRAEIYNKFFGK